MSDTTTGNAVARDTTALVVEQPIRPGKSDAVRELINEFTYRGDLDELSRLNAVRTVSLFLRRRGEEPDALVRYLEIEAGASDAVAGPSAILRESPLFDAGLGDLLESPDAMRVYAEDATDGPLIHETLPTRGESPPGEDVVMLRLAVRPGFGAWFVRRFAGLVRRLDGGRIARRLQDASAEVMEDEGMLTETIFLDEGDDGDGLALLWYMESGGQERVLDAYYDTSNAVARVSEVVLKTVLERPEELFGNPHGHTNYDLLAHATSSRRT